jgi:hypothetical protein
VLALVGIRGSEYESQSLVKVKASM